MLHPPLAQSSSIVVALGALINLRRTLPFTKLRSSSPWLWRPSPWLQPCLSYCGSELVRPGYHRLDHGSSGSTTRVRGFVRPTVNSKSGSFFTSISLSPCSPVPSSLSYINSAFPALSSPDEIVFTTSFGVSQSSVL